MVADPETLFIVRIHPGYSSGIAEMFQSQPRRLLELMKRVSDSIFIALVTRAAFCFVLAFPLAWVQPVSPTGGEITFEDAWSRPISGEMSMDLVGRRPTSAEAQ